MLIQKKIIIISSVTEILHINVIQCQLILMKHLGSFLRLTILIYSILNLGYCISSPLWLYSTSVISSCTIWLNGNCWAFFFIHLFIYSFSPLTAGRRDDDKKWNINSRSTVKYMFSQYCSSMVQFYSCVEKRQHVETKVVWSRFLGISLVLFLLFYGPRLR